MKLAILALAVACSTPQAQRISYQDISQETRRVTSSLDYVAMTSLQENDSTDTYYDFKQQGIEIVGTTQLVYEDPKDITRKVDFPHVSSVTTIKILATNPAHYLFAEYRTMSVHIPERGKMILPPSLFVEFYDKKNNREFKDTYELTASGVVVHKEGVKIFADHKDRIPPCETLGLQHHELLFTSTDGLTDEYRCSPKLQSWELPVQDLANKIFSVTEQHDVQVRNRLLRKVHL